MAKALVVTAEAGVAVASPAQRVVTPMPVSPPVVLPDVVVRACESYAYGDRSELAANMREALRLHADGAGAVAIVEHIARGAASPAQPQRSRLGR